jgi:hypothetical protein
LRRRGASLDAGEQPIFNIVAAKARVIRALEPTSEPRRHVVRDRLNAVLEARALAAGSDLKRVFVLAMLKRIDAGWQLGEFSSRSVHFFCTKIVELQKAAISPTDPGIEYYAPPFSSRMEPQ